MIRLKNIIKESKKVELGKLTTMKDDQPFMTEEQWNDKWDDKKEKSVNEVMTIPTATFLSRIAIYGVLFIYAILIAWGKKNPNKVGPLIKNLMDKDKYWDLWLMKTVSKKHKLTKKK